MNARKSAAWMGAVALLAAGFFAGTMNAGVNPESEQVSKLLWEAQTMAFQVKEDAVTMESFTRVDVSWESHAAAITQIKEHFNALGRQVTKLKAQSNSASPW